MSPCPCNSCPQSPRPCCWRSRRPTNQQCLSALGRRRGDYHCLGAGAELEVAAREFLERALVLEEDESTTRSGYCNQPSSGGSSLVSCSEMTSRRGAISHRRR